MATFTASQLIDRARSAADMHDDFVTTAQWLAWMSIERKTLDRFLIQSGYLLAQSQSPITAPFAQPNVIQDAVAIIGVYEVQNQTYRRLRCADLFDGLEGMHPGVPLGAAQEYRVVQRDSGGIDVYLYPKPTSGTYTVLLVPETGEIEEVVNTISYPQGFEERIVLGMARRALAKEETVNPAIEAEIRRIEEHVEEAAWSRLFAGARVRNVDKVERGWSTSPQIPSRESWQLF